MSVREVTLRPYQEEAKELMTGRGRALLSLCMGAGKTVTSIASVEEMLDSGAISNVLVLAPSALKYQWQDEIKRFTGKRALVIDGAAKARQRLYRHVPRFEYVIMNYETVVNDWAGRMDRASRRPERGSIGVRNLKFDAIVADEVTKLKTRTSKRSRRCRFLSKQSQVVFGLTGQPVENRPEELFAVMEFVDPGVLGDYRIFDPTFIERDEYSGKVLKVRNLNLLRKTLQPVMYRKTREDIKDQFPKVISSTEWVDTSPLEHRLFTAAAQYTYAKLLEAQAAFGPGFDLASHYGDFDDGGREKQMKGDIMSGLLAMRLVVDDPTLLLESAQRWDLQQKTGNKQAGGSKLAAAWRDQGLLDNLPAVSSKRAALVEMLTEIFEEDPRNKVVVFSSFKGMIRMISDDAAKLCTSVQFTGDMNAFEKREAQKQFKTDPKTRLFISSDAGGYGVDLPEANYLVSVDLPWSTGAKEQRDARIIRVSSLDHWDQVMIINLLMRGTIEQRMKDMITDKRNMSAALIDGTHDVLGVYEPTVSSLTEFLETLV